MPAWVLWRPTRKDGVERTVWTRGDGMPLAIRKGCRSADDGRREIECPGVGNRKSEFSQKFLTEWELSGVGIPALDGRKSDKPTEKRLQ
jgi:hypothetical protein